MKVWKEVLDNGVNIHCQIGKRTNTSWFASPAPSIDHAGLEYIHGRYPMIRTEKRAAEFKKKYKLLFVTLSEEQISLMQHTLGLDNQKRPYRNRFYTEMFDDVWEELVAKGLADKGTPKNGMICYWLTKTGVELILGRSISQKTYENL